MAWAQKPAAAKGIANDPALVGLDLNATRARAVTGVVGSHQVLPLEGDFEDVPMVLSLEGRRLSLGRAGSVLCRQSPHLVCFDFLAGLGSEREWAAGRHRLDSAKALTYVMEQLGASCASGQGIVLALPAYLNRDQVLLLKATAEKARLPLLGLVRAPLAAALAAHAISSWSGLSIIVDADDHALTATTVFADGEKLWIHAAQSWPQLNLRIWKSRLLDKVAERCIRMSRRDPRECAPAEQSLYDQIEDSLDKVAQNKVIELLIQATNWYQNLLLRPEEVVAICERSVRETVANLQGMLGGPSAKQSVRRILLSHAAGRLPGLSQALETCVQSPGPADEADANGDFGEALLSPGGDEPTQVYKLARDSVATAALALAGRFHRGELARGYLDLTAPLPAAVPAPKGSSGKRSFRVFSAESDR